MTSCDRFETEGLQRLEQGLPLDHHFATCPDCLAARAVYDRLGAAITRAGETYEPPPFWQSRVRAAIAERRARRHRPWWTWLLVPAGVMAPLVAFVLMRPPEIPRPVALMIEIEPGPDTVRRGEEAHPGDRLVLRADPVLEPNVELRVYRNDEILVLSCSTEPPCARTGHEIRASVVLEARGTYQTVLFRSGQPIPPPAAARLDRDAGAAFAAGARVELGPKIEVR